MRQPGLMVVTSVVLVLAGACAGPRTSSEPAPTAVSLPTPGFTPVFLRDSALPVSARASEQARCIDVEIDRRNLNDYGEPKGTVYADGAPVGVKTIGDRYTYVLRRNPDIAVRCTRGPGEPEF